MYQDSVKMFVTIISSIYTIYALKTPKNAKYAEMSVICETNAIVRTLCLHFYWYETDVYLIGHVVGNI